MLIIQTFQVCLPTHSRSPLCSDPQGSSSVTGGNMTRDRRRGYPLAAGLSLFWAGLGKTPRYLPSIISEQGALKKSESPAADR